MNLPKRWQWWIVNIPFKFQADFCTVWYRFFYVTFGVRELHMHEVSSSLFVGRWDFSAFKLNNEDTKKCLRPNYIKYFRCNWQPLYAKIIRWVLKAQQCRRFCTTHKRNIYFQNNRAHGTEGKSYKYKVQVYTAFQ